MAITSSAKKAIRAAAHKRGYNLRRKHAIEKQVKAFRALLAAKDTASAEKVMPSLYQALDKAVRTHYIKPNNAARTKSRLMAALRKAL